MHLLLVDALLRLGRTDDAFAAAARARSRWPGDPVVGRRYVLTAFAAGRNADALDALDALPGDPADEEALLLGIQALYEGLTGEPPTPTADADRARLGRYAERYRQIEGPSLALVETWVSAVAPR